MSDEKASETKHENSVKIETPPREDMRRRLRNLREGRAPDQDPRRAAPRPKQP